MKNAIRSFICVGCGVHVSKSCTKGVKYCNAACYHKTGKTGRPKNGGKKDCIVCGVSFYSPANLFKRVITCSVNCGNIHQGRNKILITCSVCGVEKRLSPSFSNQKFCSIKCRNEDPEFKKGLVRMNVMQQQKQPNKIEKIGYSILDEIGVEYFAQHLLFEKFCVDAFVPAKNTVIQFDGDYWHCNKSKFPEPDKRQKTRIALDNSQDKYMSTAGVFVIRIWESDLLKNRDVVLERIKAFLSTPFKYSITSQL